MGLSGIKRPPLEDQVSLGHGVDLVTVPEVAELTENDHQGVRSCCALAKPAGHRRKAACSRHRQTKWLPNACLGSFDQTMQFYPTRNLGRDQHSVGSSPGCCLPFKPAPI